VTRASQHEGNTLAVPIHVALSQRATDDTWRDHPPLKPEPTQCEDEHDKDQEGNDSREHGTRFLVFHNGVGDGPADRNLASLSHP